MEDELSRGSLSENSHSETLVGSENQGEDSCEEGEIMVEIVGSDVFVDGVRGDLGTAEIGEENVQEEKPETVELSEAMDVPSEGGENKKGECELELPDSKDESNHVFAGAMDVLGDNKGGESELEDGKKNLVKSCLELHESKDGKDNVFTGENNVVVGESGLGLPESNDGKNLVLIESMDVAGDGVENKIGGSELRSMDVCSDGVENKMGDSELELPESNEEKVNHVFTEAIDVSGEVAEEKDLHDGQIVPSEVSLGPTSEAPDSVEVDGAMVTAQVVISEEKIIGGEAVDEKATTNQDSNGGQIATLETSLNPNGEGPESISQVDGIESAVVMSQTVISIGSTIKDDAVHEKTCEDPNQDSCDGEGNENIRVDGFDYVVAGIKDLVVKSDAPDSDDSHGVKFESNHERATVEDVESLKSGGDMEMDMVHQNHVVLNDKELSKPDDGCDTDAVNNDESQDVLDDGRLSKNAEGIAYEEPRQPLDCQENDDPEHRHLPETKEPEETPIVITDASYHPITERDSIDLISSEVVSVEAVYNATKASSENSELPFDSNTICFSEIDEKVESEPMKIVGNEESSLEAKTMLDSLSDGYDKRVSIHAAKVSTLTSQNTSNNKPSFKIGECIRRVASQLTGSKEETVMDDSLKNTEKRSMVLSIESFSVNEMLSQLQRVSQEPMRRHNFLNVIHTFFMGFRSSIALNRRGRQRRPEQDGPGPAEGFEFDDVSDSYWTDRIVQNYSELNGLVEDLNFNVVPIVTEKPVKPNRRPNSRKRFSDQIVGSELDERVKRKKQESMPAELILTFAERNRIPSEISLNKMFRRFGSLMESETEVDHESGCAKVIFKRGSDAEVARNSSEAFKIFGPVIVDYRIGYEPVVSVRVWPVAIPQIQEDMVLMQ